MGQKHKNILKLLYLIQLSLFLVGLIILVVHKAEFIVLIIPFAIIENIYAKKLDRQFFSGNKKTEDSEDEK